MIGGQPLQQAHGGLITQPDGVHEDSATEVPTTHRIQDGLLVVGLGCYDGMTVAHQVDGVYLGVPVDVLDTPSGKGKG